jgi:hypothetical protein
MTPKRIQRKRTKGWRMPEGAVYVGRPTRWGNPFIVATVLNGGNIFQDEAVTLHRRALVEGRLQGTVAAVRRELAGKDLVCWCALDQACHADLLLEVANSTGRVPTRRLKS